MVKLNIDVLGINSEEAVSAPMRHGPQSCHHQVSNHLSDEYICLGRVDLTLYK